MIGPLPETILTDPLRLRQVLVNLVGNAIKFTDQGEVRITVAAHRGAAVRPRLRFDVTDTGIGMSREQIGKLFQPFSQVDNSSSRQFGGTGLGLCISKRLTEAMGGTIEVRSAVGKGSTFSFMIDPGPLNGIRMIQGGQAGLGRLFAGQDHGSPRQDRRCTAAILLAEDGPDNLTLISIVLEDAGADVTAVENGQLAVEAARAAARRASPST